ncbi:MAG: efflux RND transporter periplasmic adaptor subunit, partial [Desulfuromonadales bacterium]|nr:efflux RND transporter periplasmic adaptor subunit [Desulfuromonadales bacterium]
MKNKSWIVGAILLVGCVAAFFSAVFVHKSETDPVFARKVGSPQPVMMAVAENGTLGKVIGANGVVRPIDVFDITPKVAMTPKLALYAMGEVKEILVDIGDVVSAGEELIRFDSQRAHFALNSANAQVNEARSRMSRLQNDLTAIASMYEQDMVARIELDDLSLQLDEAKTEYHLAAENRYLAQLNYENATIFAPVGAIVMERNISVGETPRTSDVLLTLGQIDSVLVETQLAEGNLQAVYIGQDATVTTLAVPGRTYEGTVVKINPV